eukprot:scaffold4729_cov145-Isochrysis_galbana.AAC.5
MGGSLGAWFLLSSSATVQLCVKQREECGSTCLNCASPCAGALATAIPIRARLCLSRGMATWPRPRAHV